MKNIINNIINYYQMQAKALDVLVTNTQKALEQSGKDKKENEQIRRTGNFVRHLTTNLNNTLTKLYRLRERKRAWYGKITSDQVNATTDSAQAVKSLIPKKQPSSEHFQKSLTFEEKINKDIKELDTCIKAKMEKFDEALEETQDDLTNHLKKYASSLINGIPSFFRSRYIGIIKGTNTEPLKESSQKIQEVSSAQTDNCFDELLEGVFHGLNTNTTGKSEKMKRQINSKV
jgi:hypothetical protein